MTSATSGLPREPSTNDPDARPSAVDQVLSPQHELQGWQDDTYRTLHQHPELANAEVKTSAAAAVALRDAGYEVHDHVGRRESSASCATATGRSC